MKTQIKELGMSAMTTSIRALGSMNFVVDGVLYAVAEELLRDVLQRAGMSLHTNTPLAIVDKVGFLKTGDEAKEIVVDLLRQYIRTMNVVADISDSTASATCSMTEMVLSEPRAPITMDYYGWSNSWGSDWDEVNKLMSQFIKNANLFFDDSVISEYCLAMNADRE